MTDKTAVIICAGGFGSLDAKSSKLTAQLGGWPMVAHSVRTVTGIRSLSTICVVVNNQNEAAIKAILRSALTRTTYRKLQFAKQYWRCGAGGAVALALPLLGEVDNVFVTFADMALWRRQTMIKILRSHRRFAQKPDSVMTMATLTVPVGHPGWRYGRVLRGVDGEIVMIVEPGDGRIPETPVDVVTVNPSLYVFTRAFLEHGLSLLQPTSKGDGFPSEFHLPHLVPIARQLGKTVLEISIQDATEALGINTAQELAEAQLILENRNKI